MKKIRLKTLVIGVLALFLLGIPMTGVYAGKEIKIKAVACWTSPYPGNDIFEEFVKEVNRRGKGKVSIDFLGGAEIAPTTEITGMVRDGIYDMAHTSPTYYAGICPGALSGYYALPRDTILLRNNGFYEIYNQAHREAGLTFLGILWRGEKFSIISKKPIKSADLSGYKISTLALTRDGFASLGAATVGLTSMEQYLAYERGVIDAGVVPMGMTPYQLKLYEVTKYIVDPPLPITTIATLVMNSKRWDGLPADVKKLITDTVIKYEAKAYRYYTEIMYKFRDKLVKEKGMEIISLSPEDAKKMETAFSSHFWDKFVEKNPFYGPSLYEACVPWMGR